MDITFDIKPPSVLDGYEIHFWFIDTQGRIKMEMYHHYKMESPDFFFFSRFIGCDFTLHFVCDGSRQVLGKILNSQNNKVGKTN